MPFLAPSFFGGGGGGVVMIALSQSYVAYKITKYNFLIFPKPISHKFSYSKIIFIIFKIMISIFDIYIYIIGTVRLGYLFLI